MQGGVGTPWVGVQKALVVETNYFKIFKDYRGPIGAILPQTPLCANDSYVKTIVKVVNFN